MSNLNVCPLVWHFCGEVNTKKVEKIQERALRFILKE
jgi:predicted nuclease of predicted toxin-antitoxin system